MGVIIGVFMERGYLDTDYIKEEDVKTQGEDIHPKPRTGTESPLTGSRR